MATDSNDVEPYWFDIADDQAWQVVNTQTGAYATEETTVEWGHVTEGPQGRTATFFRSHHRGVQHPATSRTAVTGRQARRGRRALTASPQQAQPGQQYLDPAGQQEEASPFTAPAGERLALPAPNSGPQFVPTEGTFGNWCWDNLVAPLLGHRVSEYERSEYERS
jgi:hypothetical protein